MRSILALALIALLASTAAADERDEEIAKLKARLDALEKSIKPPLPSTEPTLVRPTELVPLPQPLSGEPNNLPVTAPSIDKEKSAEPTSVEIKSEPKVYEIGKNLKMEGTWKNGLWFETKDKMFRWNVGGVIQYDMGFFNANKSIVQSVGNLNNLADPGLSLQDGASFRRARLRFAGTMYEQVEFFAQYEFAQALDLRRRTLGINPTSTTNTNNDYDPGDDVGFNEVYLGLVKIPLIGQLRIGRHRESLNFVTATADNNQLWMERGLLFDAFNGDFNFSNGITIQNTCLNDRIYGLLGFFQANNNTNRGFFSVGDGEFVYDARVTGLPIYDEEEKLWVHVGADYSYRNPHQSQLRYRARNMIRSGPSYLAPSILNTGTIFTPDAQQIANLEFAMAWKRFTFAAEATTSWVTNAYTGGNPFPNGQLPSGAVARGTYRASGAYVEALCFLTPDHRKYKKDRPGYDRVVPESVFNFMDTDDGIHFNGGALEVGVRYDYLDLTNRGINGGMGNAVTLCLNWYLNSNARMQCNYSWMDRHFAPTDTSGHVNGDIHSLGLRFNVDF